MPTSVHHQAIHRDILFALGLLALVAFSPAQGATIHKWVDEDGVTHYSDEPPETSPTPVTSLQIETGARAPMDAGGAATDHYYSIANQWQRMQQESLQRQQRELQRAALKRETAPAPAADDYRESRSTRYVVAYPRRHHRRHYPPIEHYGSPPAAPGGQVSSGFPTTQ